MESLVTVACIPSLQNLILVGDHQQLRPHTQVRAHEDHPYYLNVSLFERLVNNNVEFDTLLKQRRMIPEIRRLLYPIYKNKVKDHPSVINPDVRPPVPGMGGVNSFFFTHQWPETRDDQMSCLNEQEAGMIVGLVAHLMYNGVDEQKITVLTFYNGQRKRILADLRRALEGYKFNVVTVDSYQGEENDVVILSLVRSNENNQIGFLNVDNRVCVALSRARCGFYIFGNGMLLYKNSKTWGTVIDILAGKCNKKKGLRDDVPAIQPARVGDKFPTRCSAHDRLVEIGSPDEWNKMFGGCDLRCSDTLPCGHPCELTCHPLPHELINCSKCRKPAVPADTSTASSDTVIAPYQKENGELQPRPTSGSMTSSQSKSTDSWKDYAIKEPARVQKHVDEYQSSPEKNSGQKLVDIGNTDEITKNVGQLSFGLDGASDAPGKADGKWRKWKETCTIRKDWSQEGSLLD